MSDLTNNCPKLLNSLEKMQEVASYLWQKGWAECNGGNLSVDVTDELADLNFSPEIQRQTKLDKEYPALKGRYFLVTGSGYRYRDFAKDAEENSCILKISADNAYDIIWGQGINPDFRPTSELPSHLAMHSYFKENKIDKKVVLHTHPTELIAMSHLTDYADEKTLNHALWGMLPEVKVVVPKGLGLVPYGLPSSEKLAMQTMDILKNGYDVVMWEMHGALACAKDVVTAFDIIDTLNKAAEIVLMCLATGNKPRGLSKEHIDELVVAFGLED